MVERVRAHLQAVRHLRSGPLCHRRRYRCLFVARWPAPWRVGIIKNTKAYTKAYMQAIDWERRLREPRPEEKPPVEVLPVVVAFPRSAGPKGSAAPLLGFAGPLAAMARLSRSGRFKFIRRAGALVKVARLEEPPVP